MNVEAQVERIGKALLLVPVKPDVAHLLHQTAQEPASEALDRCVLRRHVARHNLARLSEGGDTHHVLRPGPSSSLLVAPVDEVVDLETLPDVKGADALRRIDLVAGERREIDIQPATSISSFPIAWTMSEWKSTPASRQTAPISLIGKDGACLVVREHDGDEDRLLPYGPPDVVGVDQAAPVRLEVGHGETFASPGIGTC